MRPEVLRTINAVLPIAVCVALAMLEVNVASVDDTAAATHSSDQTSSTPLASLTSPGETMASLSAAATTGDSNVISDKHFANDTLLGMSVPCTKEEKECLKYNRIYSPSRRKCYPLGDGPEHCRLAVNRGEFEKSQHITGHCSPTDLCVPFSADKIRMAFDSRCIKRRDLYTVCGRGPVNLIQHFFGDFECVRSQGISPPEPPYIAQPEEEGRCVFPNLRHDLSSVTNQESRILFKECFKGQSMCFVKKQVMCGTINTSCCDLLEQGPCGEGHRVVLNRTAWEGNVVQGLCAPVYPCGNESRLMAFDHACYNASTILRVLCPGGVLVPNAFGEMSCVTRDFYKHVIDLRTWTRSSPEQSQHSVFCELAHHVSYDDQPTGTILKPECGITNGSCVKAISDSV